MSVTLWLIFGIIMWVIGYRQSHVISDAADIPFLNKHIWVPKSIYLLCGMPKSKSLPDHMLSAAAVICQIYGILLIIFGLFFHQRWPVTDPELSSIVGLCGGVFISYIITYFIYKKYCNSER